ncbi:hypothetical protein L596_016907 [Steinernema carpocapsae]|uniref:Saposin B-type domain-containing protein n=1 Tax=Steinernema carpocapsae TaxID=34508 RepID=A0A4U5NKI0_STECR|nr:hypothetical protein L596_016906 [Steinernema carpocapsae]TKR83286.1 hypothetical protein L596_016907 [Steinernema carpocapsae]
MKTFLLLVALFALSSLALANGMPDMCKLCQDLVLGGQKVAEYKNEWLKSHISDICQKFGEHEQMCTQVLNMFSGLLNTMIKEKVPPQEACSALQLCSKM